MKNFEKFIYDWQSIILKTEGIQRDCFNSIYSELLAKPIKIITGFRRSGKSFLMKQIAKKAVEEKKIPISNILYLNFEDVDYLEYLNLKGIENIIEVFINKIAKNGKKLFIFDEIQLVQNWDKLIRTLYEKNSDYTYFLSGSNSDLLSSELGSNLAGRFIEFQILPFNFNEFLRFNNNEIIEKAEYYRHQPEIKSNFDKYLKFGGLPEISSIFTDSAKKSYLQGVINKVILDDIIKRFQIRNISLIEELFIYLLFDIGNPVFISKITKKINSIKKEKYLQNTIAEYVSYFVKTFSLIPLQKFDWKLNRVFESTKKFYAIDTGLINAFGENTTNIDNKELENLVFLHLKRSESQIYFGQNELGKEIDFIVKRENKFDKYQVCRFLTQENEKRELDTLILVNKYLNNGENYVITEDESKCLDYKGIKIQVLNIVDFLISSVFHD